MTPEHSKKNEVHAEWLPEDIPENVAEALMADEGTRGFIHLDECNPAEDEDHVGVFVHEKVRHSALYLFISYLLTWIIAPNDSTMEKVTSAYSKLHVLGKICGGGWQSGR